MPLQIDATSSYACKLAGTPANKCIYDDVDSAVQHLHARGPAADADRQPGRARRWPPRSHPAAGNWLYFVNGDAAGHLFFTNSEKAFTAAVAKCVQNHWGCG